MIYIYIYLTEVGLTPGGSSTSHIYTQTVRNVLLNGNIGPSVSVLEHAYDIVLVLPLPLLFSSRPSRLSVIPAVDITDRFPFCLAIILSAKVTEEQFTLLE
jgi:hypothetical protein